MALLALTAGTASMQAVSLQVDHASVAVTCNTQTGPGTAATVTIKPLVPLVGAATLVVAFTAPGSGLVVSPPGLTVASVTLSTTNQVAGLIYTINTVAGCGSTSTGATTLQFKIGATNDVTVTVNDTLTSTASPLVASAVTIVCAKSGGNWTPGAAQTVSVTSPVITGGTAFTVDTSVSAQNYPTWLVVTPTTGGTATASPVTFTVQAATGCGGFALASSNVATLHLLSAAPNPDKVVNVTLQILAPAPLTVTPSSPSLTYVKGSGNTGKIDVNVTSASNPAPFFTLNTATLPIWLTVDATSGSTPKSLRFTSTTVCDTLAPGTYTASIGLKVSGYADVSIPITLQLNNKAPRLSVAEGTTRNISWTLGTALPTPVITAVSSDSPISYASTSGGTLAPIVNAAQISGLAYSFGTPINVNFNPLIFAAAQPGSVLTGTVTLTWGSPASTIVVTFNITIVSPGATVTGLSPASLPTANPGAIFTVVLTGTGFVTNTDASQKTKVGIVLNGAIVTDTAINVNVVNPSNIILTFTVPVPAADPNLPFAIGGTGGPVTLGICNPAGGTCSIPTGTATLTIGSGPIVQAVTSASAFTQVALPANPPVAPYDMISIFGSNFCSSGGTGCSSSQILYGVQDATLRYSNNLSPDSPGLTQRSLTVTFQVHGAATVLATAPLLFATNGQINVLVPGVLTSNIGSVVDVVVNFGYASGLTMKSSTAFPVNIVATDPGLFTVGANGQGDGAILNSNYSLVTAGTPAGIRAASSDSDTVQFYLTGLGAPDSIGGNTAGGTFAWHADCISVANYLSTLNVAAGTSLTDVDGTVIQSALINPNRLPPCVKTDSADVPTVTIGGQFGTVTYAGFVADTVAGLYQINVTLPQITPGVGTYTTTAGSTIASITAPVQLPVVVSAHGVTSQASVSMWVQPSLKLTGATVLSPITGTVGVALSGGNLTFGVTNLEGTSPFTYKLTSGVLPAGVLLNAATGVISGTPAANSAGTYMVTVTATDSANIPVKGTLAFAINIAGGLFMTQTGTSPFNSLTFGTGNANITHITATSGVFPYTYAITTPVSLPLGMTINASTGIVGTTNLTPGGTYQVTVTATDSTAGTPLTGTITFDIVVALNLAHGALTNGDHTTTVAITTMTATGNNGAITWSLVSPPTGVTIDATTGIISNDNTASVSTPSVTVLATDAGTGTGSTSVALGQRSFTITIN